MSTIQSLSLIVSSSCSTTITVLPRSRSRVRVSIRRRLSRWWRPIDGSSSTYSVPTRPDPIWLASRMRCASPPASVPALRDSAEVVEPDVEQEPEPGVDLLRHPLGDHLVALAQLERGEELRRLADRHLAHLGDVLAPDGDRQRVRLEPRAVAGVTRHLAHVPLVLLARPVALGSLVAALDPRDDTLVLGGVLAAAPVAVLVLDRQLARTCRAARSAAAWR